MEMRLLMPYLLSTQQTRRIATGYRQVNWIFSPSQLKIFLIRLATTQTILTLKLLISFFLILISMRLLILTMEHYIVCILTLHPKLITGSWSLQLC